MSWFHSNQVEAPTFKCSINRNNIHTFRLNQDIDNLHSLAKSAGGKLLYDLNIQLRLGSGWDPTNAYLLLKYIQRRGYARDMAFELGNEPNYPELAISGSQIGRDALVLKNLTQQVKGTI